MDPPIGRCDLQEYILIFNNLLRIITIETLMKMAASFSPQTPKGAFTFVKL